QQRKALAQLAGRADGDQPFQVLADSGVAIGEHATHRMSAEEDLRAAGRSLDRLHRGRQVVEEVAIDVPAVVEVCGKLAGQASSLALQRDRAPPVAAQLQDVQVGAEEEEVLDELPARPGMAV